MYKDIDEFIMPSLSKYKDNDLKSVNASDAADDLKTDDNKEDQ